MSGAATLSTQSGRRRILLVGVGRMGEAHLEALLACPDVELVGVAEADPARRARVPEGIFAVESFERLFQEREADAALIALPLHLHGLAVKAAFAAGLDVLKERPLARDLEEARRLVERARAAGRKLVLLEQAVTHPVFETMAARFREGRYGEPVMLTMINTYRWPPAFEGKMGWRADRERSGGVALLDSGWHGLSLLDALMGAPLDVSATLREQPGAIDTAAVLSMRYANGALGTAISSFVVEPKRFELTVHGSKAAAVFDGERLVEHFPGEAPVEFACGPSIHSREALVHQLSTAFSGKGNLDAALRIQTVVEAARESARIAARGEVSVETLMPPRRRQLESA